MLKKDKKGFTIIEVLIVLAIAGAIMLIVFLAVPALQRNAKNNAYRAEASRVAAGYNEVVTNKGGSALAVSTATSAGTTNDAEKVWAAAVPKEYTTISIIDPVNVPSTDPTAPSSTVYIVQGKKCAASPDTWQGLLPGTSRSALVLYTVETPSGASAQCLMI